MKVMDFRLTVFLVMFGCALQHVNCFSSQNQKCITSEQKHGTCQLAEDCKSLPLTASFDTFKRNRSFHLSDYLKANRGNCGISQGDKTSPLYCCENQASEEVENTLNKGRSATIDQTNVKFDCNDAKNQKGTCRLIKDCPHAYAIFKRCDPKRKCKNILEDDLKFLFDSVKSCDAATKRDARKKAHVCCSESSIVVETETPRNSATVSPIIHHDKREESPSTSSHTVKNTTSVKDLRCTLNEQGQSGSCKRIDECPIISEISSRCDRSSKCSNIPEVEKNLLIAAMSACKDFNFIGDGGKKVYHACCGNFSVEQEPTATESEPTVTESEPKVTESEPTVTESEPTDTDSESSETDASPPPIEPPVTDVTPMAPSTEEPKESKYISLYKNLLPVECGAASNIFVDKIWGGDDTKMTEHSWLVALMFKNREKNNQLEVRCGGSMITKRFVLTAAHCLTPQRPDFVRIGEHQFSTDEDCAYNNEGVKVCNPEHLDVAVNKVFTHEDYFKTGIMLTNDIGLIRLSRIIHFNSDQNNKKLPLVLSVCLPSIYDQETKEIAIPDETKSFEVVGWGKTENGIMSDIKQSLKLKGFNRQNCSSMYKLNMLDSQLCAGGEKSKDSCQGDSGGPLMREPSDFDVPYYLDGIVSAGRGCGKESMPGIYTRVSSFMEWILDTIEYNI